MCPAQWATRLHKASAAEAWHTARATPHDGEGAADTRRLQAQDGSPPGTLKEEAVAPEADSRSSPAACPRNRDPGQPLAAAGLELLPAGPPVLASAFSSQIKETVRAA